MSSLEKDLVQAIAKRYSLSLSEEQIQAEETMSSFKDYQIRINNISLPNSDTKESYEMIIRVVKDTRVKA